LLGWATAADIGDAQTDPRVMAIIRTLRISVSSIGVQLSRDSETKFASHVGTPQAASAGMAPSM
jgi:hypothetical protein